MPSSKTDTGIRLPRNDDQTQRLRDTTQDKRLASRLQDASDSGSAESRAADPTSNWTPEEMFESTVDQYSDPVPDRYAFTDGARMERGAFGNDEADAFVAANANFD
ncbi:uncharacterized protein BP01DRAFT_352440 [Aspergillus saccharolyticus JOP 1030-1]|uniref:Uncharacterized protein n=1 Tax=Aspergillus saccharolyticus JOP 1030-1 TaxID=1450539 RepID=A0A318ZQL7_9EURO|nr:hypothetical protein BP01DRAFT_352440 [Aspergillus saccharolyticus JOP 1030-1]PYH49901.1 hypothetical protein BP01DRAFT_352440 [Aspergillus saccharolyticus JOP 1030-1]